MKVVITGGSGFIGSAAIEYFLKKYKKWQVLNIDNLSYPCIADVNKESEKNPRYAFELIDIRDYDGLSKSIERFRPDYIINFAAQSHVDRSLSAHNVKDFVSTNVQGVVNLLNLVNEYKVEKFVQISTDETGGSWENGGSFYEDDILKPRNNYASSKAAAEHFCNSYFESYKTPVLITRCTNNFGKFQHDEKFIPRCVSRLIHGMPIELNLDGSQIRSWISTTNHIRAVDNVLHNGKFGQVYHVTGGVEKTNKEIAFKILEQLNLPIENNIVYKNIRPSDDLRYSLGSKQIHETGYIPLEDFESFFSETVLWYKNYYQNIIN